ncbi:MAG: phosphate signaling complex protein PhoU [Candidatus Dadabacteria bacterium]|nr:phosphate signaling complex protein PhoU [Candidatus Dadabacteria bacterium]NIS07610.1 phosphate signaling complex protein PhoU [Candidatus Dadabacteria bacterium]NIV42064.1 phosphate signaling complex protein PhoU [Candidatus Dadabacteria bacterium]NIX16469.1 phosphate signaling complex protein PhoU [Candidatus Dadabacteria bacterium]NIY21248.1 phosphate signaling complex protein PhoU [Candidatus Dadabacteria bacterium]
MIKFEEELNNLVKLMLNMASVAEEMITKSTKALVDRNMILAEEVIKTDQKVNEMEIEIDNLCVKIQALYHPEAEYLRTVTMILKINNDLERIGDHAVNIAKKVIYLSDKPPVKPLIDIPRMADKSVEMLRDSLKAFIDKDSELAVQVCMSDDEVDILEKQVMRELISYMVSDPRTIDRALALIFIARDLERVADLATNISEDVYYIVHGKNLKHHALEKELG